MLVSSKAYSSFDSDPTRSMDNNRPTMMDIGIIADDIAEEKAKQEELNDSIDSGGKLESTDRPHPANATMNRILLTLRGAGMEIKQAQVQHY